MGYSQCVCRNSEAWGLLPSLKPGVLAEGGPWPRSWWPFRASLSSGWPQGPCLGISTCACPWPGRPSLWVEGLQTSSLCRYPNREPVAEACLHLLTPDSPPGTCLVPLGVLDAIQASRTADSCPISEDIARPEECSGHPPSIHTPV